MYLLATRCSDVFNIELKQQIFEKKVAKDCLDKTGFTCHHSLLFFTCKPVVMTANGECPVEKCEG